MSYRERQTANFMKVLVTTAVGLIIAVLVVFFAIAAAMGDCAPNPDGTGCENDGLMRFLMFPGSLVIGSIILFFLFRWTTRSQTDVQ